MEWVNIFNFLDYLTFLSEAMNYGSVFIFSEVGTEECLMPLLLNKAKYFVSSLFVDLFSFSLKLILSRYQWDSC